MINLNSVADRQWEVNGADVILNLDEDGYRMTNQTSYREVLQEKSTVSMDIIYWTSPAEKLSTAMATEYPILSWEVSTTQRQRAYPPRTTNRYINGKSHDDAHKAD